MTWGQVRWLSAVFGTATLLGGPIRASAETTATQPVDPANTYADCTFGFSIPYPPGAIIEREKRSIRPSVMEIVRFVLASKAWSQAVWFEDSDRPLNTDLILERFKAEIQSEFAEAQIDGADEIRVAARPAVRMRATFTSQNAGWIRQQAAVRTGPSECFHIILLAPQTDAREAERSFDGVLENFQILRSDAAQLRLKDALSRGQRLLQQIGSDAARFRSLQAHNTFLRLVEEDREIGFMRIREEPAEEENLDGIGVVQHTWLFRPTGEITQSQQEMFLSADLTYARWDSRMRILTPARADEKEQVGLSVEHGLRENDKLIVSYSSRLNDDELKEKIIRVERSFCPPAWFVVLPRLVDMNKPEVYAFGAYDSERRGLIVRSVEVAGEAYVAVDGRRLAGFRLLDGEGLVAPFNEINVDGQGNIQRVQSGPLQMLATTDNWIKERYDAKVNEAIERMKKYPLKTPRPPAYKPSR